jgi:hypothetical protein
VIKYQHFHLFIGNMNINMFEQICIVTVDSHRWIWPTVCQAMTYDRWVTVDSLGLANRRPTVYGPAVGYLTIRPQWATVREHYKRPLERPGQPPRKLSRYLNSTAARFSVII